MLEVRKMEEDCPYWGGRLRIPPCGDAEEIKEVEEMNLHLLERFLEAASSLPPGEEAESLVGVGIDPANCPYQQQRLSRGHPGGACEGEECHNCSSPFRVCSAHWERYTPCQGWECLVHD